MPLIYHHIDSRIQVAVWQTDEQERFFSDALKAADVPALIGRAVKHPEKRKQWLASRHLLEMLFPGAVQYYRGRKPYLLGGPFISLSHSENLVGVMLSRSPAGLDVQFPDEKLRRIAAKFTDTEEPERIGRGDEILSLTVVWAVKEAVFKTYGTLLPFRDIQISGFNAETGCCRAEVFREGRHHTHSITVTECAGAVVAFLTE